MDSSPHARGDESTYGHVREHPSSRARDGKDLGRQIPRVQHERDSPKKSKRPVDDPP